MIKRLAGVTAAQAKQFFEHLANLRDDDRAATAFEERFGRFLLRDNKNTFQLQSVEAKVESSPVERVAALNYRHRELYLLRSQLREIWDSLDIKDREWRIFLLRADPNATVSLASGIGRPTPDPFQQAVLHLLKCASQMLRCRNGDCFAPCFFSKRRSQKFCSQDCADSRQRELKLRWWNEHGAAWRRRRKKANKLSKRRNLIGRKQGAKL